MPHIHYNTGIQLLGFIPFDQKAFLSLSHIIHLDEPSYCIRLQA